MLNMKLVLAISLLSVAVAFPHDDVSIDEGHAVVERAAAVASDKSLWTNGIIYYAFDHRADHLRGDVKAAMSHIEKNTCIRFRENYGNNRIYITADANRGCTSPVGMTGGQQTLNLGRGCRAFGIILHQLGHAIGLLHEHTRSDRDQYVNILWENIIPGSQHLFVQLAPNKNRLLSRFDYQSIMMFGERDYATTPELRTITPIMAGVQLTPLRQKKGLSALDIQKINQLYKCNEP